MGGGALKNREPAWAPGRRILSCNPGRGAGARMARLGPESPANVPLLPENGLLARVNAAPRAPFCKVKRNRCIPVCNVAFRFASNPTITGDSEHFSDL